MALLDNRKTKKVLLLAVFFLSAVIIFIISSQTVLAATCSHPNTCLASSGCTPAERVLSQFTCPTSPEAMESPVCCAPPTTTCAAPYDCKPSATCADTNQYEVITTAICEAAGTVCCRLKPVAANAVDKCPVACTAATAGKCPEGKVEKIVTGTDKCVTGKICCVDKKGAAATDQSGAPGATDTSGNSGGFDPVGMIVGMATFLISMTIHLLSWFASQILVLLLEGLVFLCGYNSFIRNEFVSEGWKVLRDLVNMFFVLGLLLIAFATVLKIERYSWNKLLGKLLLMAVLVNFSKTICGVIIDFFQVLMMTFVYAFKDITAGNIFRGMGMMTWFKVSAASMTGQVGAVVQLGMLASAFLGLILSVICMIVIFIFCVIIGVRIVALWVLVVFSPLAFFAYVFEGSAKIGQLSQTWWQEFLQYCMIGPLLAFILWISVATLPKLNIDKFVMADYYDPEKREGVQATFSEAGGLDRILKYMMSILMLVVGLGYAQKFKVVGAGLMAGAAGKMKDMSVGNLERGARWAGSAPGRVAKAGAKVAAERVQLAGGPLGTAAFNAQLMASKEGRGVLADRGMAWARAKYGKQPGARAEQMEKEMGMREKTMRAAGADKDPRVMKDLEEKYKKSNDGENYLALLRIKAEQGKIQPDDYKQAIKMGAFDKFGPVIQKKDAQGRNNGELDLDAMMARDPITKKPIPGKKADLAALTGIETITKGWEKKFEENNGFRTSFSPFVRDPVTNDWKTVEPGSDGAALKAKDSESSISRSGVEKLSKAANNSQAGNIASSSVMEAFSHQVGFAKNEARMHMIGDTGLDNVAERNKEMTTILTDQKIDQARNQWDTVEKLKHGSMSAEEEKNKKAEFVASQVKSGNAYDHLNDVASKKFGLKGKDKDDFIAQKLGEVSQLKDSDYYKDNAGKLVNLSRITSGKYEAGTGKELQAGTEDANLKSYLENTGVIAKPAAPPPPPPPPNLRGKVDSKMPMAPKSRKDYIVNNAGRMLNDTERMDAASRKKEIIDEIRKNAGLQGKDAEDMADEIIKIEVPVTQAKEKAANNMEVIVDQAKDQFRSGKKDLKKIDMTFNVVKQQLADQAKDMGLSDESFQMKEIEGDFNELKKAMTDSKATQASMDAAVAKFQSSARTKGFDVGKK